MSRNVCTLCLPAVIKNLAFSAVLALVLAILKINSAFITISLNASPLFMEKVTVTQIAL